MKKYLIILVLLITTALSLSGCGGAKSETNGGTKTESKKTKELYVYCGTTMRPAMEEIAKNFEQKEGSKVVFDQQGGTGELLTTIRANKAGDLFLPGSDSYIKTCLQENHITSEADTALVGYNKAALFVQKGNPKNISGDLNNLLNKEYKVLIGNPKSGSIGSETKKILEKVGIYNKAIENTSKLTNDSRELLRVIKSKEADLTLNWYAAYTWDDNAKYVDVISIDEKYAPKSKLVLGVLKYSKEPELAQKFLAYAKSAEGQKIFDKFGLYNVK